MKNSNFTKGIELCNRTACQTNHNVMFYNKTMHAWYCVKCARLINDASRDNPLCVLDETRQDYERNYKKDGMLWSEYKQGIELFSF
jgi:hypothetical protein